MKQSEGTNVYFQLNGLVKHVQIGMVNYIQRPDATSDRVFAVRYETRDGKDDFVVVGARDELDARIGVLLFVGRLPIVTEEVELHGQHAVAARAAMETRVSIA